MPLLKNSHWNRWFTLCLRSNSFFPNSTKNVAHSIVLAQAHLYMFVPFQPFNFEWITLALYRLYCLLCYSIAHTHISSISMGGCFDVWCACIHCLLLKTISISTRTSVWPMVKRSENLKFITNHLFVLCVALYRPLHLSFVYGSNQINIWMWYACATHNTHR